MTDWMEFLRMDGYAPYVWGAYGLSAVVLLLNALWSWRRWQRLSQFRPPATDASAAVAGDADS